MLIGTDAWLFFFLFFNKKIIIIFFYFKVRTVLMFRSNWPEMNESLERDNDQWTDDLHELIVT